MAYTDFKTYIQDKFADYLLKQVSAFDNEYHDGIGFHTLNVLSVCDQEVDNLIVKSIRCTESIRHLESELLLQSKEPLLR